MVELLLIRVPSPGPLPVRAGDGRHAPGPRRHAGTAAWRARTTATPCRQRGRLRLRRHAGTATWRARTTATPCRRRGQLRLRRHTGTAAQRARTTATPCRRRGRPRLRRHAGTESDHVNENDEKQRDDRYDGRACLNPSSSAVSAAAESSLLCCKNDGIADPAITQPDKISDNESVEPQSPHTSQSTLVGAQTGISASHGI